MKEREMERLAGWIGEVLAKPDDAGKRAGIRREVEAMCAGFPVPGAGVGGRPRRAIALRQGGMPTVRC